MTLTPKSATSKSPTRTLKLIVRQEEYHQRCNDWIKDNHTRKSLEQEDSMTSTTPAQSPQGPSQTIGPFSNCTHHTTGLFSTIYRTYLSSPTPQTLAIKLTNPSRCQAPHDPKREARLLAAATHPHIIPLVSTHTLPPSDFLLVFPFQPLDLETLLHSSTPLLKPQVRTITSDLFSALAHLHSLGIIHRDVKPSNILLASPSGPAYLADFGIAWSPSDPASEPSDAKITDVGTTCYRAPELLFGQKAYNCTLDLWAAGCVVAEIIYYSAASCAKFTSPRSRSWTLFTAGALGSELALIKSIFETLGTPTLATWPEAAHLPDWNKMSFRDFPAKEWEEILPGAEAGARELVRRLVRYQSTERMSASEAGRLEWDFGSP